MSHYDPAGAEGVHHLSEARELRVFLHTVGDLVRLHILRQLAREPEMSVTELARDVRVSQPLLSWHLGVLKRIDLVQVRKEGRLVWYSLNRPVLQGFRDRLDAWLDGPSGLGDVGRDRQSE